MRVSVTSDKLRDSAVGDVEFYTYCMYMTAVTDSSVQVEHAAPATGIVGLQNNISTVTNI